jgi:hypothetical protein
MSDQDDLPPGQGHNRGNGGFAGQLGNVFGGAIMLAILFVVVGIVAYGILRWIR